MVNCVESGDRNVIKTTTSLKSIVTNDIHIPTESNTIKISTILESIIIDASYRIPFPIIRVIRIEWKLKSTTVALTDTCINTITDESSIYKDIKRIFIKCPERHVHTIYLIRKGTGSLYSQNTEKESQYHCCSNRFHVYVISLMNNLYISAQSYEKFFILPNLRGS